MTTTITLSHSGYDALLAEQQRLTHQLRLVTIERDCLKERVDAFLHRLYAAKSEARTNPAQRDLFLNEAEALAPQGTPIAEEATPEAVEVAAHHRKKRGRKPLDPHLPREIVRHELPKPNAFAPMMAPSWWKSGPKSASSSTSCRNRSG